MESNIFLMECGVGQNLLKGSVTLSGRKRLWSHFSVQTRCNLSEVFWSDCLKKIQFDNNKLIKKKEKITSSERGLFNKETASSAEKHVRLIGRWFCAS